MFASSAKEIQNSTRDAETERALTVQAWVLPMLVGSMTKPGPASTRLEDWVQLVGEPGIGGKDMPLSIEAALAQGFKYAANRRPYHPQENAATRAYLAAQAERMLKRSRFWFSRLTLLHSLCLWSLSGTTNLPPGSEDERRDHVAVVRRWIRRPSGREENRLVREAAKLVVETMKSGQPERFIWIDESGVVTKVGSRSKGHPPHATRSLWIAPSAGWLTLDPRAKQLVADILILLNLAERGDTARDRSDRLERINTDELPYCLTDERCSHLLASRTVGATRLAPGEKCKGGCPVDLCPYPPKGEQPYRVELSEAFCRNQQTMLKRRRRAPWQDAPKSELREFWRDMEERARL
jgi:hypothetical protein